jgi:hypothetical protein
MAAANLQSDLESYASKTSEELLATSQMIAGLYANMGNFRVFQIDFRFCISRRQAIQSQRRRLGKPHLATSFLLHDHPAFGPICKQLLERAMHIASDREASSLIQDIRQAIEPIDVAGFSDASKKGWYPVNAEDLQRSAGQSGVHAEARLSRCCWHAAFITLRLNETGSESQCVTGGFGPEKEIGCCDTMPLPSCSVRDWFG